MIVRWFPAFKSSVRLIIWLSAVVLISGAVPASADAPFSRAQAYVIELRREASAALDKARQRMETAESDLRQSRAALDGARRSNNPAAVQVATEAVRVSEDERRQAERLVALAKKRLGDRDAMVANLEKARSRGQTDSFLVPVEGDVRRKGADGKAITDPSAPLLPGQKIETGRDGKARLFLGHGDVDVRLGESSSFEIEADSDDGLSVFLQKGFGAIRAGIKNWSRKFEVRCPMAVLAVRGTEFAIDLRDGREALSVYEGVVVATPVRGGELVTVRTGERLSFGGPGPWPAPFKFDPAADKGSGK